MCTHVCLPVSAHTHCCVVFARLSTCATRRRAAPRCAQPRLRQRVCVCLKVFPAFIDAGQEAARIPGPSHLSCYFTDQQRGAAPRPLLAAVRNDARYVHVSNTTFIVSFSACGHVKRHHLGVYLSRESWKDGSQFNYKDL